MLIENESIFQKGLYHVQVSPKEIAIAFWSNDASAAIGKSERILNQNTLAHIVQNLEAMDKLARLLRVINSGKYVRLEPVLDSKISLEVRVEKLIKLFLKGFCRSTLSKREVFIVRKLTEIFAKNILKVI